MEQTRIERLCSRGEILEGFLKEQGKKLDAVLLFAIDDDVLVNRLSNRRTCRSCGGIFNLLAMDKAAVKCPSCGGELFQRDDDHEAVIRSRLKVFHEQTEPLAAWYRERNLLREIDASDAPEAIYERVKAALNGASQKR